MSRPNSVPGPQRVPRAIGPYEIVRELGRGAMGVVYAARRADLGREVALKVLHVDPDRTDLLARFQREAQAAARLAGHPAIVGVYDLGTDEVPELGVVAWFSMELVQGQGLDRLIAAGDLDPRTAAQLVAQAARAAHHAHQAGIIHRDLKPANILIEGGTNARLTDFGLVSWQDVRGDLTRITTSDLLVGTPAYMAPEQVYGQAVDARADVWALGATLYECLAGHPPFQGESVYSVLSKLLQEEPPPLRPIGVAVPPELEAVVMRALTKDLDARYPDAATLADDLEAWLAGRQVSVRQSTTLQRLSRSVQRHRGLVALGAVACISAAVGAGIWWYAAGQGTEDADAIASSAAKASAEERMYHAAQAWRELAQATQPAMLILENRWNEVEVPEPQVANALARVRTEAGAVAQRHPGAHAPEAWVLLAEVYASGGQDLQPLANAVTAAGDDPFPALVLARVMLQSWAAQYDMPELILGRLEVSYVERGESEARKRLREQATSLLTALRQRAAWVEAADASLDLLLLESAAAIANMATVEQAAEVRQQLRPLLDQPALAGSAARLSALAAFLAHETNDAIQLWERLYAERGWIEALDKAAGARLVAASQALARDDVDGARRHFQAVDRHVDVLLPTFPDVCPALLMRAQAAEGLAMCAARRGEDPRPDFRAAIAAADRAVAESPEPSRAYHRLTEMLLNAAGHEADLGGDAKPLLERALAVADRWVEVDPDDQVRKAAHNARGAAATQLARIWLIGGEPRDDLIAKAIEELTAARALAPRDTSVLTHLAQAHRLQADRAMMRGESPMPYIRQALELQREAVALDTLRIGPRVELADTLRLYGSLCAREGEDAAEHFAEALRYLTTEDPAHRIPELDELEAEIRVSRAEYALALGRDPRGDCQRVLAVLDRADAVRGGQTSPRSARSRAHALWLRARWELQVGIDPMASLQGAAASFAVAMRITPSDPSLWSDRSLVFLAVADWLGQTGGDPMPPLELALADADVVVERRPNNAGALHTRGTIARSLMQAAFARGVDHHAWLERARSDLNQAARLDATAPSILNDRGLFFRQWAEIREAVGDPNALQLQLALKDFDRALELAPDLLAALNNRGNCYAAIAVAVDREGNDSRPWLQKGIADFDRCVALNPDDLGVWNNRALLHHKAGDAERGYDGDPEPHYTQALADYGAVLHRNPQSVAAYSNRGLVHASRGEAAEAAGRPALAHYRAAVADHSAALAVAPNDPGTLVNRAVARQRVAAALRAEGGGDPTAELDAALTDLAAASAANPRLWQAHAMRGRVLADLGRRDEALAAYDAALRINPTQRTVLAWKAELEDGGK